jgi:hypothetical protein
MPNTGIVRCVLALATPPLAPALSRRGKQNAFQPPFCAVHRISLPASMPLCYLLIDSTAAAARQPAFSCPELKQS